MCIHLFVPETNTPLVFTPPPPSSVALFCLSLGDRGIVTSGHLNQLGSCWIKRENSDCTGKNMKLAELTDLLSVQISNSKTANYGMYRINNIIKST